MPAQSTRIPNVPIRTPMFDEAVGKFTCPACKEKVLAALTLGNLTRTWIIFFEKLGRSDLVESVEEITAVACQYLVTWGCGIGANLSVAADVAPHYVVRRPGVGLSVCTVAKTWPTGSYAEFDIKRWPAAGGAGVSIFGGTKLVLPAGATSRVDQVAFASNPYRFELNDILTLDVTHIGSTIPGRDVTIELKIQTDIPV